MPLFEDLSRLPDGFIYRPEFIDAGEETALLERIAPLDFHAVEMRGVVARRRVIQHGWKYSTAFRKWLRCAAR